jgi:hypothetical protein
VRSVNRYNFILWIAIFLLAFDLPGLLGTIGYAVYQQAFAQENRPTKITVAQALSLLSGLRTLDGHQVIVKQNGADAVVVQPWDFGSGLLRLKIANDISILAAVEKSAEDARVSIIKEIVKGLPPDKDGKPPVGIVPGTPEFDDFQRQYTEVLNGPAAGTQDLARIKASELKLDKNELSVTALSALSPILDQDVK